jgi:hypothetical protein
MPRHYQNACFNRLAQAANIHYRGDLFDLIEGSEQKDRWFVDLPRVAKELAELLNLVAAQTGDLSADTATTPRPASVADSSKPIDELLLAFESLGDTCEFGLVQRHAGVEPLGLLRFAGMMEVPGEARAERLARALLCGFEGLGAAGTIAVYLDDGHDRREFLARESTYHLQYHTGVFDDEMKPDDLQAREIRRLGFLRRKLIEDLKAGEKIWVWQSGSTTHVDQVRPLLDALRTLGPNTLLWVAEHDEEHPPGTAKRLERDFIKGYVQHFEMYAHALDLSTASWIEMCQSTYDLCHPTDVQAQQQDTAEVVPARPLSAMEFLAQHPPGTLADPAPVSAVAPNWAARLVGRIWNRG